jgi:hypothetical protein
MPTTSRRVSCEVGRYAKRIGPLVPVVLICLAGCSNLPLTPDVPDLGLSARSVPSGATNIPPRVTPELNALFAQTNGQEATMPDGTRITPADGLAYVVLGKPLRDEIAKNSYLRHYVRALKMVAESGSTASIPRVNVNAEEFCSFAKIFTRDLGRVVAGADRGAFRIPSARSLDNILVEYYKDYFDGSYVTRDGIVLAKPGAILSLNGLQLSGSVSTETLADILTVFLEAFHDYFQDVPIFTDNNNVYLNGSISMPTSVKYGVVDQVALPAEGSLPKYPNITIKVWKTTRYISIAASKGSEALGTLIAKTFGGVDAGPSIVLGKFSIGDNTSLTQIIETALDVNLARDTEWLIYLGLIHGDLKTTEYAGGPSPVAVFTREGKARKLNKRPFPQ